MKKRHKSLIGAYILVVLAGVIWHAGGASAEDTIKLTVNGHTTSTATMNNMQPGDTMASGYRIINDGNEPFDYSVAFKFLAGDADLYNILQMTLQKEGVILYSGVMSEAAGVVTIGSLAGGAGEDIQMQVLFPPEAGNEFQEKTVSVAFEFTATAAPAPTAGPTSSPQPTEEPAATVTPVPTATPGSTSSPGSTPAATIVPTDSPAGSASPGSSAAPSQAPEATAAATPDGVTVSEAPVPLGGGDDSGGNSPAATPDSGAATLGSTPAPSPGDEIPLTAEELPLGAPDGDGKLPDTAGPWYNLIAASIVVAILSMIAIRRLGPKK
ncbi:hypothetical protein HQN87_13450 [Paenibacillus tritici]|uniref:Uncharacterized protein n=1 Tax=Paenibacillus tritici TaxID=1873425 RepID=A0ABX2DSG4_9BACL|nr:hypothetical protein [Paenibacillus tritici]NQX46341.1 hypothetical protein [Paenibacillus tritici]